MNINMQDMSRFPTDKRQQERNVSPRSVKKVKPQQKSRPSASATVNLWHGAACISAFDGRVPLTFPMWAMALHRFPHRRAFSTYHTSLLSPTVLLLSLGVWTESPIRSVKTDADYRGGVLLWVLVCSSHKSNAWEKAVSNRMKASNSMVISMSKLPTTKRANGYNRTTEVTLHHERLTSLMGNRNGQQKMDRNHSRSKMQLESSVCITCSPSGGWFLKPNSNDQNAVWRPEFVALLWGIIMMRMARKEAPKVHSVIY